MSSTLIFLGANRDQLITSHRNLEGAMILVGIQPYPRSRFCRLEPFTRKLHRCSDDHDELPHHSCKPCVDEIREVIKALIHIQTTTTPIQFRLEYATTDFNILPK